MIFKILQTAAFGVAALVLAVHPILGSEPAPNPRQARFEIRFMENMIDHHQGGIEMSRLCVEKAVHAELRQICQSIIAAQSSEIQLMQSWLGSWYGEAHTPRSSNAGMNKLERLSGAAFEIQYMEMISDHHAEALKDSTDCLLRAYHKDLRDLCERMINAQAHEINVFRTWLCQWYARCEAV